MFQASCTFHAVHPQISEDGMRAFLIDLASYQEATGKLPELSYSRRVVVSYDIFQHYRELRRVVWTCVRSQQLALKIGEYFHFVAGFDQVVKERGDTREQELQPIFDDVSLNRILMDLTSDLCWRRWFAAARLLLFPYISLLWIWFKSMLDFVRRVVVSYL